jgi:hypothetical protein
MNGSWLTERSKSGPPSVVATVTASRIEVRLGQEHREKDYESVRFMGLL